MNMNNILKITLIGMVLLFFGCNQHDEIFGGTYHGTVEVKAYYPEIKTWLYNAPHHGYGKYAILLELKNGKYTCICENPVVTGSIGTYSIRNNKIKFSDDNIGNPWNTLILDGEYNYNRKKLEFSTVHFDCIDNDPVGSNICDVYRNYYLERK
jgi:hypothetical protein